jgi:alpha,alpha-trehalose phosphorylase
MVEARKAAATYTLLAGPPLEVGHHGKLLMLSAGEPVTEPIPPAPVRRPPAQPRGRAPARRGKPQPV